MATKNINKVAMRNIYLEVRIDLGAYIDKNIRAQDLKKVIGPGIILSNVEEEFLSGNYD